MDNPEKLAAEGAQDEEGNKQRNMCCKQTNTNNVNKKLALLRKSQHGTQNVKIHNRTTQKNNKISNTDHTIKPLEVLAKGKPFLLLIRHPSCYSYIQSSPLKILAVIEERKHLRKK